MPPQTAVELAARVRAGKATAEATVRLYIDAVLSGDGPLQAFAAFDPEVALEAARAVDAVRNRGPLAGVPVAVKDVIDTAQYETAYGSPIYRGHRPALDAACVTLLRQSGAVILGKTVTAELATFSPGPTRNPHALSHTPGGSSSGSAAAVAAGLAPLALGTQTAGSVIRPASFCGVVGYKPSPRCVPRSGVKGTSDTLDEVGAFATCVDDIALIAAVLAQQPEWASLPALGRAGLPPRVGWTLTSRGEHVDTDMRKAVTTAAERARKSGAPVAALAWPTDFDRLFDAQRTIQFAETARALGPEFAYRRADLSVQLIEMIQEAHAFDPARYPKALAVGRTCVAKIESLFEGVDVIVAPSAPGEAPASLTTTGDPLFNRPWQLLGCPVIGVPFGRGLHNLPLGVSLVARPGQDALLIEAAAWLERCWAS